LYLFFIFATVHAAYLSKGNDVKLRVWLHFLFAVKNGK